MTYKEVSSPKDFVCFLMHIDRNPGTSVGMDIEGWYNDGRNIKLDQAKLRYGLTKQRFCI